VACAVARWVRSQNVNPLIHQVRHAHAFNRPPMVVMPLCKLSLAPAKHCPARSDFDSELH
jgi:hypothetical protein